MSANRRGIPTEHCQGEASLPAINICSMRELGELTPDPRMRTLAHFAALVFFERQRRQPEAGDTVKLRGSDDLAVAAIFGLEQPDINQKVVTLIESLNSECA